MITRRDMFGLAAALALLPVPGQAQVGLAERRAMAAYRKDKWPGIEQAVQQAAGFAVPVDVEWDQLTIPGNASNYADDEFFGKTIFEPLTAALRGVAADQMGRDALRAKLRRVHVRYDEKTAVASNYPNGLMFQDGVLDINWRPYANTSDVQPRTEALTQILEKNL